MKETKINQKKNKVQQWEKTVRINKKIKHKTKENEKKIKNGEYREEEKTLSSS